MALQHLRSSTANKRPVPSGMADGQLAVNSNLASPGLFLKDSNGDLVKVGPVHIGTTAPNVSPASGGQAGNSKGEQWLDTASSRYVFKVWDGTAWRTQDGEFVNVTGDTMTGALVMDNQQQVQFRETTANGTNYIALQATASVASDKIITLPDITGTVVTTGDTGSVTSTMILDGTIVNADINASAAIVDTKLATIATAGKVSNSATTATSSGTVSTIVARDGSGNFTAGTITATLAGNASTVTTNANLTGDITSVGNATSIANGVIVNDDVNASAAIAGSKISPNFGSQTVQTTGIFSAAAGTAGAPSIAFTGDIDTGLYNPGVNQAAISTAGTGRLFVDANGNVAIAQAPSNAASFTKSFNISAANASIALRASSGGLYADQGIFFAVDTVNYAQIYNDGVGQLIFRTGSGLAERLRITSAGLVGIGTSAPSSSLHVNNTTLIDPSLTYNSAAGQIFRNELTELAFGTATSAPYSAWMQARFNSGNAQNISLNPLGGRVGIGTTSPGSALSIDGDSALGNIGSGAPIITLKNTNTTSYNSAQIVNRDSGGNISGGILFRNDTHGASGGSSLLFVTRTSGTSIVPLTILSNGTVDFNSPASTAPAVFKINTAEAARIDSSGRLLVGTSIARGGTNTIEGIDYGGSSFVLVRDQATVEPPILTLAKTRGTAAGANTIVANNDYLGIIDFKGADGANLQSGAYISAFVDGTPGTNDMPGRLVFSTTSDGASSPTERMRITSTGAVTISTGDLTVYGATVGRGAGAIVSNTAVGNGALAANTTGTGNTAIGRLALVSNTTGTNNTANGLNALQANTTGSSNTATGFQALFANTTGNNNTANGLNALFANTTGSSNVANGLNALQANTTGTNNTATGFQALFANTTGSNNTANGLNALLANTTGTNNTANGLSALASNTTGTNNTANSSSALFANTTGTNNTATGFQALAANTTGTNNTANGLSALASNTTGNGNTANGLQALLANTTGTENTAIGGGALSATTSGTTNTAIGNVAGSTNTTGTNNTFIGYNSQGASATANNVITLGNNAIATLRCQVTTITSLSDARDKTNIVTIPAGLDFINALRPVAFDWNTRDGQKVGIHEFGFIAQELQEAQESTGITVPNLVSTENPEKLEASAGTLLPVLVSAVQELTTMVKDLQEEIAALKAE